MTGDPTPVFKVFREPEKGKQYVLGVDTSEGLGHGDNSAVQVLEAVTGEQVAVFCDRCPPDILALVTYRMGRFYLGALAVVEANNHGVATLTVLRQLGYRSLFRRRQINHTWNRETEEFGFKTTRSTKPLIISQLDEALRNNDLVIHEAETITELKGYVRDESGRMSGSPFDDRVIALALANHGRGFMHQRIPEEEPDDDYLTFGWWLRQAEPDEEVFTIGSHQRRSTLRVVR